MNLNRVSGPTGRDVGLFMMPHKTLAFVLTHASCSLFGSMRAENLLVTKPIVPQASWRCPILNPETSLSIYYLRCWSMNYVSCYWYGMVNAEICDSGRAEAKSILDLGFQVRSICADIQTNSLRCLNRHRLELSIAASCLAGL